MSFWNTLKKHAGAQFLEVIEWLDDTNDTIVWRFPVFNQAITDNSKLVVREGQAGLFQSEGKLSEVFGPGTYTLDTRNTPVVAFFQSIAYALNYPYKGDVYFISTRQFTDNGWGTQRPFMMRDAEFGPVRVRGFGVYSYRITNPATFIRQIVGTDGLFTTDEINDQLMKKLVSGLASSIGKARIPILDLASNYMDLADNIRKEMNPSFEESYGITITDFTISNISLPEAVEKALDDRTRMGMLGNLDAYTKLQAAEAIQTAAANPGLAGAGMGMGVGFGMGNMMGNQMAGAAMPSGQFNPHQGLQPPASAAPPPLPQAVAYHYNGPTGQAQINAQEVAERVAGARDQDHMVWQAGWPGWKPWKEVPEIAKLVPPPAAAPPPLPGAGQKYHYSGGAGKGEKTLAEVVEILTADPDGAHHLWQSGWDGWKAATDVPEVQQALAAAAGPPGPPPLPGGGGPPPPPM
ncbi:MAG: antifreeze protein [Proteobacteria bacterium]|jgi:membrane protease subunit (stomatin/prohibitin family)|nr:antifreeze protein [Pseudomonadota bacterium]